MIRMVLVWSLVAACVAPGSESSDPKTSDTSQAGTSSQGTSSQGTSSQGTSAQGTSSQGTSSQGTTSAGSSVTGARVVGTELQYWTRRGDGLWQLFAPDRTCLWDQYRRFQLSCSYVNLATQPSPLAGSRWPMTFVRDNGNGSYTNLHLHVQIGSSATQVGAVRNDTTTAMFDLRGSSATSGTVACSDPAGCRRNSDLYLYDVKVIDFDGTVGSLCPSGQSAFALAGTWDASATFHPSSTEFTFACTNGTIAKCVRWGYRPWTSAIPDYEGTSGTPKPLADFHQACVHAAMADYCGTGHSFTKNGTVIDISDMYFIKSTRSLLPKGAHYTASIFEAEFDVKGAFGIDHTRYQELNNADNPDYDLHDWCPGIYSYTDGFPYNWIRPTDGEPWLQIESTPSCAHSEFEVGKWLHSSCSACTDSAAIPAYCTDPNDSRGWDAGCVAAASTCNYTTKMAPTHGECTTGVGMNKYDSGCTLALSLKGYAGCFDTTNISGWSSTCVAAANQYCTGGREHGSVRGNYGFCNQLIPLVSTTLSTY
jgi:hypothetical protein